MAKSSTCRISIYINGKEVEATVIGVKNNGEVVGIPNIDKVQLQAKDRLISGISPSILSLICKFRSYPPSDSGDTPPLFVR